MTRLETARGPPRADAGREPMRVRGETAVWPWTGAVDERLGGCCEPGRRGRGWG